MKVRKVQAVTWNAIKTVCAMATKPLLNREIADLLGADYADVANLTRLMAKAGELVRHGQHGKLADPLRYWVR